MSKLYLLLLFCAGILRTSGQAGSLDPTFGNNGIQTTAFLSHANTLQEKGRVVLTSANGDIFVVVQANYFNYTRIAKYLPGGTLDSSYGSAGYSNIANLVATSATLQQDKIIVAGYTSDFFNSYKNDFALARYTADGKLDSSFGENGLVSTDFNSTEDQANSIALQGDKIVAAGYTRNYSDADFALARYTANGALDTSFGENGRVTTDFNNFNDIDIVNTMVLQADKIIVAGYTTNLFSFTSDIALARYTANGTLDSSFGKHGKLTTDFNIDDRANSIMLQGDKIVVAGYTRNNDDVNFALARYGADGALDASFGENGKVTTDINGFDDYAKAITLQENKIILAGYTGGFPNSVDFALVRYTADGRLDNSFGKNGRVTTDFNGAEDYLNAITLQGNKILVVGYTYVDNGYYDFALARYDGGGDLDTSFGEQGLLAGYFPVSHTFFKSTAIQGNKVIAAGYALNDNKNNSDFALARYNNNGTLDTSFGVNGRVTTDFNGSSENVTSMVLQGDKIVVAGTTDSHNSFDFALARYTANGTLDSSFGVNGFVTTDFNGSSENVTSMVLQGDKIVVGGYTIDSANNGDIALARYTADGRLDSTFGVNGRVITDFYGSWDEARSIAIQGSRIIVGGYTTVPFHGEDDFVLARYTTDGKLDTSFGVNGKTLTDFNGSDDHVNSLVLQGDKIVVGGYTSYRLYTDFALARYTADGTLDTSFGVNGRVKTDLNGSEDVANIIELQGSKIIVGGYTTNPVDFSSEFAHARYTANGTPDSSFGENGKVVTPLDGNAYVQDIALHESRLYAVGILSTNTGELYGVIAAYQLEAPEPAVSITDITVPESKKLAVVTVRLSKPATKLVRVQFTTRNKTATSPKDYTPVKGTLFFIPGVNTTFKIFIPIVDDNEHEATEQFEVRLTKARNATIMDSVGVVTIPDDDAQITKGDASLRIQASPNPAIAAFTIQLQGTNYKHLASVRVYDVSGRLLEERKNISIGQSLRLGDLYKAGTYIIEAVQGSQRVQTKVIKTGK
jgi:uncharacterized delta-60 repeat protein